MATWKKVIVSGSNISQLNNDAGYVTAATGNKAFSTASYNGTLLLADSPSGSLVFASSSGQGLTISANAGNDTLTFGLAAIPNSSLANSSVLIGGQTLTLGAAATTTLTGMTSITSTSFTGSLFGTASYAATVDPSGLPTGTVSGSSQITYSGITGVPAGIVSASVLSGPATQGQVLLTTNGVAGTTVTIDNLGTTGNPTFNNVIVTGDLTVNGTTTTVNTTDLLVEDKFILLASGSASTGDGGIIIDRGSDGQGNIAFGFDSATDRWGFQNGLVDTTNAITIGTDGNSAFVSHVFTEATHTSAPTTGEFVTNGAIYTATSGDIFIYS